MRATWTSRSANSRNKRCRSARRASERHTVTTNGEKIAMDRHAKKQEKKRKARELAKKQARSSAARRPGEQELLLRAASRGGFGPCFVSVSWQDMNAPALLSLVVSRELPN